MKVTPPMSLRQKMIGRVEWRSVGVQGPHAEDLSRKMNQAFQDLSQNGFNITEVMHLGRHSEGELSAMIIAQRFTTPVVESPDQQAVPVVAATQTVEINYTHLEHGKVLTRRYSSLKEAVRQAIDHLNSPDHTIRPLGIHLMSVQHYNPKDIHSLWEHLHER